MSPRRSRRCAFRPLQRLAPLNKRQVFGSTMATDVDYVHTLSDGQQVTTVGMRFFGQQFVGRAAWVSGNIN